MPLEFCSLAEVIPTPAMNWLWKPYIPTGSVTILEGFPGNFKSFALCDLIARVTTGRPMPIGGPAYPPKSVLYFNSEDPSSVIKDRLTLAEADISRVVIPKSNCRPTLPTDIEEMERQLPGDNFGLVIFDPLASFTATPLSADAASRRLMDALNSFAQRKGVAIIGLRHFTKSNPTDAIYGGAGSHAITAAARSVLVVGENPANRSQRIMAQLKNNLAPLAESALFEPILRSGGVIINWLGTSPVAATELRATVSPKERPALDEAKRVLFSILADGPITVEMVQAKAGKAGVRPATLVRAKKELAVLSKRRGFGPGSIFFWELPPGDHPAVSPLWSLELDILWDKLYNGSDDNDVELFGETDEPNVRPINDDDSDGLPHAAPGN